MRVIEDIMPIQCHIGRKVDMLASEYLLLKSDPNSRMKVGAVEKFLIDNPDTLSWENKRIARVMHCSESLVRYVKKKMNSAPTAIPARKGHQWVPLSHKQEPSQAV